MKTIAVQPVIIASEPPIYEQAGPKALLTLIPGFLSLSPESVQDDALLIPRDLPPTRIRRMIVLVPAEEIAYNELARRVWQIATSSGFQVLYLTLKPEESQAAYQRRRLAGLAAVTADQDVRVQAEVSTEKSWSLALEKSRLPGDLLVCAASHKVADDLFRRKALGEKLAESTSIPVYLLGGIKINPKPGLQHRIKEVLTWAICFAELLAFFAVQVWIDRLVGKPASTVLFCLVFAAELYLLFKTGEWLA